MQPIASDVTALLLLPPSSPLAMATTTNNVDTILEVSAVSPSYAVAHIIVLQDRLIQPKEMERNDSETTDDSPFTSALTTPVDQDVPISVYQGIHEALAKDMEGPAVDSYFDLKAVGKGVDIGQISQRLEERRVVEVEIRFMLLQNSKAFHGHPLDCPRRNVGTGGDVGPGGDASPGNNVILGDVVVIASRRHYKRHALSFPAIPRTGHYGWGFE